MSLRDPLSPITAEVVLTAGPIEQMFSSTIEGRARLFRCAYPYDLTDEDVDRIHRVLLTLVSPPYPIEQPVEATP